MNTLLKRLSLAVVCTMLAAGTALAAYPERPITMIVPLEREVPMICPRECWPV